MGLRQPDLGDPGPALFPQDLAGLSNLDPQISNLYPKQGSAAGDDGGCQGIPEFSGDHQKSRLVQPEPGLQCLAVFIQARPGKGIRQSRGRGQGQAKALYPGGVIAGGSGPHHRPARCTLRAGGEIAVRLRPAPVRVLEAAGAGFEFRHEGVDRARRQGTKGSRGAVAAGAGTRATGATGPGRAAP